MSCIIVATIYHPPNADCNQMIGYLMDSLTSIETANTNCGLILMGDLNRLDTSRINQQFKLKQLVNFTTRSQRTLDVVLTNIGQYYDSPQKLAPFGLSDHYTVKIIAKTRSRCEGMGTGKVVKSSDVRPSNKAALGRVPSTVNWSCLDNLNTCLDKLIFLMKLW